MCFMRPYKKKDHERCMSIVQQILSPQDLNYLNWFPMTLNDFNWPYQTIRWSFEIIWDHLESFKCWGDKISNAPCPFFVGPRTRGGQWGSKFDLSTPLDLNDLKRSYLLIISKKYCGVIHFSVWLGIYFRVCTNFQVDVYICRKFPNFL